MQLDEKFINVRRVTPTVATVPDLNRRFTGSILRNYLRFLPSAPEAHIAFPPNYWQGDAPFALPARYIPAATPNALENGAAGIETFQLNSRAG